MKFVTAPGDSSSQLREQHFWEAKNPRVQPEISAALSGWEKGKERRKWLHVSILCPAKSISLIPGVPARREGNKGRAPGAVCRGVSAPQFPARPPALWPSAPRLRANPRVPAQWEEGNPHPRERLDTAVSSRRAGEGAGAPASPPAPSRLESPWIWSWGGHTGNRDRLGGASLCPPNPQDPPGGARGVPAAAPSSGASR